MKFKWCKTVLGKREIALVPVIALLMMTVLPAGCGKSSASSTAAFIGDPVSGVAPLEVQFNDHSIGDVSNWAWDFDSDGSVDSTESNPSYVYAVPGTYTVSLTVSGDDSETNTKTKTDYVEVEEPLVKANFDVNPDSGVAPLRVEFTNHSVGGFNKWQWDFDNNGTVDSTQENPFCVYNGPGTYTVTLTANGDYGSDTKSCDIVVYAPVTANFIADPVTGISPLQVQFTAQYAEGIDYWQWDFDNNGTIDSIEQDPLYTYQAPGIYTVSLVVSGGYDSHEVIKTDYVQVSPQEVDFRAEPISGPAPLDVQFTDMSTDHVIGWSWDFDGNGTVDSVERNPAHVYEIPGIYTVSLTARESSGESKTEAKVDYIRVAIPAEADFSAELTSGNAPLEVQFTDQSEGDIGYWFWDFDDDGLVDSTARTPVYSYELPGLYSVSLTVSGPGGTDVRERIDYIQVIDPWCMFRHDAQHTGRSSYVGPKQPDSMWSFQVGGSELAVVGSSPAVGADGTIYVGSDDGLFWAINPDGSKKWDFDTSEMIFSSPAIGVDGTIYFGSQEEPGRSLLSRIGPDIQDGTLWALNPDGSLKWKYETGGWVLSSPVIGEDGAIYFGSGDGNLYALNPNGGLKWSYSTGEWILSSAAIGQDGTIYFGSQEDTGSISDISELYSPNSGHLWALYTNGSLKWSYSTNGGVLSSPAIGDDGTIYFGVSEGSFCALNSEGGLKWSYSTEKLILSSPAIGLDGTVYFGSQQPTGQNDDPDSQTGILWALDNQGNLKWTHTIAGWILSSPAIDVEGTIYFGSGNGNLYSLDPSNGQPQWNYEAQGWVLSCPAISNGVIYFSSSDGKLYAIGT